MVDWGIRDGFSIVFNQGDFDYVENGRIVVIEKVTDEEGLGAWSLKRLRIDQPRLSDLDEFDVEIDSDEPEVRLRSHSGPIEPWQLDPTGQYKIRGVLLRWLPPEAVHLVESEALQGAVEEEDARE